MEYDDFSLCKNFEKLAKEYCSRIQQKGFAFVRLNQSDAELTSLGNSAAESLQKSIAMYDSIIKSKNTKSQKVTSLQQLSQDQLELLKRLYKLEMPKNQSFIKQVDKAIAIEASVLNALFKIYNYEDDCQKHLAIKNMIDSRLKLLTN